MTKRPKKRIAVTAFIITIGLAVVTTQAVSAPPASSETQTKQDELVDKITEKVLKKLREEGVLEKEIDAGINRFVKKQQEAQAKASKERVKNLRPVSAKEDHIYGNPDAEISLIEYSDFECPYCKRFHTTPKQVVDAFDGKVNWVYRHFPLGFHKPGAEKEAEASECAAELGGNDAFWKYGDLIYQRTRSNGKGFPVTNLVPLAGEIGLDKDKFQTCLDSGRHASRVKKDYQNGARSGVTGTPGNFLVDHRTGRVLAKAGAIPFARLKTEIDRLLKE